AVLKILTHVDQIADDPRVSGHRQGEREVRCRQQEDASPKRKHDTGASMRRGHIGRQFTVAERTKTPPSSNRKCGRRRENYAACLPLTVAAWRRRHNYLGPSPRAGRCAMFAGTASPLPPTA